MRHHQRYTVPKYQRHTI